MTLAGLPRERPPLSVCEQPMEFGPDGGIIVNNIRGVLLESQVPPHSQDKHLFHKEVDRFQAALDPVASWLLHTIKWSAEDRLNRAIPWTRDATHQGAARRLTNPTPPCPQGTRMAPGNLADSHAEPGPRSPLHRLRASQSWRRPGGDGHEDHPRVGGQGRGQRPETGGYRGAIKPTPATRYQPTCCAR